eukprot:scaffold110093_cov13-Tisochrysis_lutea.AAC.1
MISPHTPIHSQHEQQSHCQGHSLPSTQPILQPQTSPTSHLGPGAARLAANLDGSTPGLLTRTPSTQPISQPGVPSPRTSTGMGAGSVLCRHPCEEGCSNWREQQQEQQ